MSQYTAFTEQDALAYVQEKSGLFTADEPLNCYEFGDGNLNMVFRISNHTGASVILKQALPYARCVGESWPLTLDRARIEAQALIAHSKVCPEHTVKVLDYNPDLALILLEDLGDMQILRGAQNQAKQFDLLGEHVADYLAKTAFYYSDFYLDAQEKKALVAQFINPELCQITEDLFFSDPYRKHERNNYPTQLQTLVSELWQDKALKAAVAQLKAKFLSCPQSLLHGDMHSGSIFVDAQQTKMIDPEFAFFGPIGFDLGSFIGNLLLNYCAQNGRIQNENERHTMQAHLLNTLHTTVSEFARQFTQLASQHTQDVNFQEPAYISAFIQSVIKDAVGYCATELIRRTIGLAHVADIDTIADESARLAVQQQTINLGRQLIKSADDIHDAQSLKAVLSSLLN